MIQRSLGLFLLLVAVLLWNSPVHGQAAEADDETTLATDFRVRPMQANGFVQEGDAITLAGDAGTFVSEVYRSDWEFIAVGVTWENELPADTLPMLEVRTSTDGRAWSAWTELEIPEDDRPDGSTLTFANLLFATGRYVQLHAALHNDTEQAVSWEGLKLTVIDGRPGPSAATMAAESEPAEATNGPAVISRAAWGANEGYRYRNGSEIWPREFYSLDALFVHHTASPANYADPAAAVRSIYYYHAVTNGWGDIGYHYLIDQYGRIYEGRFGSEQNGRVAEAGHALGYNAGTMGVSIIGNYTHSAPDATQMNALKDLLASRATRYEIDPEGGVWLNGAGSHPDRWFSHALMAHRDSHNPARTTCPGDALYARMGEIRRDVKARLGEPPPAVQFVSPAPDARLDGLFTIEASPSSTVTHVEYYMVSNGLDGSSVKSYIGGSNGWPWRAEVDSHSLPAGRYTLQALAKTASGATATAERTITVAPFHWTNPAPVRHRIFMPIMQLVPAPQCQYLIRNSAFQSNTDWLTLLGPHAARYDDAKWSSPPQSLRVGMAWGENYWAYSSAWLPLTLPADYAHATLTLKYLPESGSEDDDQQYIQIRSVSDPRGTPLAEIVPTSRRHETAWQSVTYDMSRFRGQKVYLYMGAFNDGNGGASSTRLYVDDVQVRVCR